MWQIHRWAEPFLLKVPILISAYPESCVLKGSGFLLVGEWYNSQDKIDKIEGAQENHEQKIEHVPRTLGRYNLNDNNVKIHVIWQAKPRESYLSKGRI